MKYTLKHIHVSIVALVIGLMAGGRLANADSITVAGIKIDGVRVTNIENGVITFVTPNGDQKRPLEMVDRIEIKAYPELAKADDAYRAKNYGQAADLLSGVISRIREDYLKHFAEAKLVHYQDRAGKFDLALRRYAKLLEVDKSPFMKSVAPVNFPKDEETRKLLAQYAEAEIRATNSDFKKEILGVILKNLKGDPEAAPPMTAENNPFNTSDAPKTNPIEQMLKDGKAAEALDEIEKELKNPGDTSMSRLLFYRGQAQAALKKDMDAALSYMRVVIHFPTSPVFVETAIEAGKLFKKMGIEHHAEVMFKKAVEQASRPEHVEELKKLGYQKLPAGEKRSGGK